jgi:hypothetical protein
VAKKRLKKQDKENTMEKRRRMLPRGYAKMRKKKPGRKKK